tara:strand:+ start:511 stop:759 length:249 start_codon:yes stop_codon:yes gene_type:complete
MNKEWVLFHLKEALEEVEDTIKDIESDESYDESEFSIGMTHLYHHVNTAWNSRSSKDEEARESNDANFEKWRKFPIDIDMSC